MPLDSTLSAALLFLEGVVERVEVRQRVGVTLPEVEPEGVVVCVLEGHTVAAPVKETLGV